MAAARNRTAVPVKKAPAAKATPARKAPPKGEKILLDQDGLAKAIEKLAKSVVKEFPTAEGMMVLGIQSRGAIIARRLQQQLEKRYGMSVGFGSLNISLYRDDLTAMAPQPEVGDSEFPFDVSGSIVILVDDVLFTGRTIRAALDEIIDFGRPSLVRLAAVVDRGWREYPIQADYIALPMETTREQDVSVEVAELDGEDRVVLRDLPNA